MSGSVLPQSNRPPSTPTDSNPATNTVAEGAALNTLVGITAFSTDDDGVTYSLGGDTSGGGFKINASTGVVSVADPSKINFETASHSYIITVNASDGFSVNSQNFTIAVTDVAPSTPVDSNAAANQVNEGASVGSPVGITASSTDINGPSVTWSLTGDSSGGGFTINATTGVITVADSTKIDYETSAGHAYTVTAQASDGTLTSSQNFTINVLDVDMPVPVDTNAAANTVAEGAAAGTTVGVTISSVDRNGPATTYSLLGDSSGGGFTINPTTGVVTVADPSKIDFESSTGHAYKIVVLASSSGGNITQQFTIGVTDVAPSTPTDSDAATNAVVEGAVVNAPVGITAHSTDVNGPGVTWSLTSDSSGGGFKIDSTTGMITVADGSKIDYETSPGHAYSVTATASDGTLSSSQAFNINVIDFDMTVPADSNAAANTVAEGAAAGSTVGVTVLAVDRNGPGPTYSLLGDSSGGGFTIDPTTGVVTVADPSKIDFESSPGHVYKIVVLADNGDRTSAQFTIGVTDVAPSTPTDSNAAANTVAEGAANGSTVGVTASSTDLNGPAVTWSLVGDSSGGGFTIDASTGVITVADSTKIDYETAAGHAYTVTAQASDGTLTSSQTFSIAVTNVAPSTPADSDGGTNTVAEGAGNGSTVGVTASSTEANGPAVTYSLIGDSSGGGFTINAATGVVTVADSTKIDYETAAGHAYTVTAQASDGALTSSQTFTIAVSDVAPSTPTDSNAAANTVAEGAANGSTVGVTASSTDVNGPAVTYSLVGDTSGGGFTINATTGVVTVADSTKIDFETSGGSYTVTAQASDGTLSSSQTFTIAVSDVAPSTPTDSNAAANTVTEGAANGSTVGVTASSTDVNGPAVTYSLVGDTSGGGFTINATTGVVTVADSTKIDFETSGGSYTVTAQASDGTLSSSQTFTIAVSDVAPSTPTDSNAAANTVAEGAANGSTVGVTASSTDVNGPAVTYSLVGDSSGGGFAINSATGVVTVADSTKIDYETAAGHAYTVTAQASDGALTSSQTFTIAVTDVAPSTPTDSNAAANTVAEGAANGSTVGVTASSTDVNGPAVTYSLVGDTSGGGFTINATTGVVTVADSTKIDFETSGGSYTVTAQASDGTLSSSQTFTIAVTDVAPSTPTDSNAAANTVTEGAANGSTVGVTASSTDVNGPAVTYSLVGDTSGGGFAINSATGVVTVADSTKIDFETSGGSYTVTAQASDGTLSSSQTFTIAVSDVAPSTPVDSDAAANTVTEGAANGSTVGVTASSTDLNGPAVTYSLVGDTSGGGFAINSATGVVTVADSTKIDFETSGGSYTVTAQASDGTLSSSQTFTIAVSDVAPSTPTDSNAAANTVTEGAANGSTVGVTASSTDLNGPAVTYSLVGDTSGGGFAINATTGVVTVADSTKIDFETSGGSYTVTAQASDGTLTSSQTFTIAVTDVAPSTPTDSNAAANTVTEGAANGSTVGVTASSTDLNGPAVTYSLVGDTSGGGFAINSATGVVTVADSTKIDFETSGGSYTVTAQASDGTLSSSQTFTIAVSDVAPSTPVDSDATANSVVQSAAVGTYTGVTASSTDVNGPAVTYSLVGDTSGGGFTINATTGAVTVANSSKIIFTTNPTTYDVTVDSSDGTLHSQQTFSINVDPNAAPAIDSDGGGATAAKSAAENQTAVTTVHATDPDSGPSPISYSIVGGDDQAKFAINSSTGVLTFIIAPDFENPTDTSTAGNNTYIVTVQASDGAAIDQQTITVTVTDVNDAPVITSNGGGATASINVNENTNAVTTVTSTDQDSPAQTLTYSLAGGADQGKFSINSSTGVLTFNTAPNFEAPTDVGGDNGYDVIVRVTDNGAPNLHDDQAITVHIQDVNEAPDTGAATVTGNEDATSIAITITGTDVDAGDHVASFHITNIPNAGTQGTLYSDAGLTTQITEGSDVTASGNAATVYFVPNANFNTHAGAVTFNAAATDSHGLTDATPATETINVTAVDDAPVNNGVPANFVVESGFTHAITGLSISDVDANEVSTPTDITTTLASAAGIVTIGNGASGTNAGISGGATVTTNASGSVVLTGSIAQINTTLGASNGVVYTAADNAGNTTTTVTMTTNDHGHNGTGGPLSDVDTISVGVIPQVWFINGDQSGVDATAARGSQANPFSTITEFNASSGPGVNDYIYLKAGTYTGDGINLKDGQTLLGDDQALSFANPLGGAAIVIETSSGARPTINVTTAGDQGIDLAQNNTIHGINITTASGTTGLDDGQAGGGNAVGTLAIDQMQISGAGQAVDIDQGGALNVSLESVSSSGGAEGIQLAGTASSGAGLLSGTFSAFSGAISGSTTAGFLVGDGAGTASTGGTAVISYSGTISAANAARTVDIQDHSTGAVTLSGNLTHTGTGGSAIFLDGNSSNFTFSGATDNLTTGTATAVNVTNQSGGTVGFSGTLNIDTSTGTGVNLGTNTGSTINFTGGNMTIDATGAGNGFAATGGGTVNVTGSGNHIATVGGTALNISNTTIGASNVTFHDINANGGTNGIVLNNTGSSGHLTVTGGGSAALGGDNSGGTIQNTTGDGISLTSTNGPSFTNVNIQSTANSGIRGTAVTNFTLANSTINNVNTAHTSNDGNVSFNTNAGGSTENNISGNVSITNNNLNNSYQSGIDILNYSGTISNLAITGNHFTSSTSAASSFGNAISVVENRGASAAQLTAGSISDNTITNFPSGAGIQVIGGTTSAGPTVNIGSSASHFIIDGNTISGAGAGAAGLGTNGIALTIGHQSNGYFTVGESGHGNTITNVKGNGIAASLFGTGTASYDIGYNTIDANNTSGSAGINTGADSATSNSNTPTLYLNIHNNNVQHTQGPGILSTIRSVDGTGYFKIENNSVTNLTAPGLQFAIRVDSGNGTEATGAHVTLQIDGNTAVGTSNAGHTITDPGIGIRQQHTGVTSTFQIVGLSPSPANDAQMEAYVSGQNPGSASGTFGTGGTASISSGATYTSGTLPAFPLLASTGGVQASSPTSGETRLTPAQLDTVVAAAIAQWEHAGASAAQLAAMHATVFSVADLAGDTVGEQVPGNPGYITIDTNAAGHGWFVDPTPTDNSEFTHAANAAGTDLYTDPSNAAAGHLDLLTTVTHELGHVIGLTDKTDAGDVNDLMYIDLVDGERRMPDSSDVVEAGLTGATPDSPAVAQGFAPGSSNVAAAGTGAVNVVDAGHGGGTLLGSAGADSFVFGAAAAPPAGYGTAAAPLTHVAGYSAAQGDSFDFSALTSAFHNSSVSDSLVVRAVEDASGKFATLQIDNINPNGSPSAQNWTSVAQIDGAHAGDAVNILIDNHSVHLAQIHVDLLV